MRRALPVCAAAVAALSMAACQKASNATANTAEAASNAVSNAADAASNAMADVSPGQQDAGAFASNAIRSSIYQMNAARVAQTRSKNPDVQAYATRVISDHSTLRSQLQPLIVAAGQSVPVDLDPRRQVYLDKILAANEVSFDRTFIDQQVSAQEEQLAALQGYAKDGSDPALKAAAAKAVPTVQAHLDMAKKLQASLSGGQ